MSKSEKPASTLLYCESIKTSLNVDYLSLPEGSSKQLPLFSEHVWGIEPDYSLVGATNTNS